MSEQVSKICKHKPGEEWTDGCCSPNPSSRNNFNKRGEQVRTEATPKTTSVEPKHLI